MESMNHESNDWQINRLIHRPRHILLHWVFNNVQDPEHFPIHLTISTCSLSRSVKLIESPEEHTLSSPVWSEVSSVSQQYLTPLAALRYSRLSNPLYGSASTNSLFFRAGPRLSASSTGRSNQSSINSSYSNQDVDPSKRGGILSVILLLAVYRSVDSTRYAPTKDSTGFFFFVFSWDVIMMKIKAVAPIRYRLEDQSCLPSRCLFFSQLHNERILQFEGANFQLYHSARHLKKKRSSS